MATHHFLSACLNLNLCQGWREGSPGHNKAQEDGIRKTGSHHLHSGRRRRGPCQSQMPTQEAYSAGGDTPRLLRENFFYKVNASAKGWGRGGSGDKSDPILKGYIKNYGRNYIRNYISDYPEIDSWKVLLGRSCWGGQIMPESCLQGRRVAPTFLLFNQNHFKTSFSKALLFCILFFGTTK